MRTLYYRLLALGGALFLLLPDLAQAAGGKAEQLINVADTRVVTWGPTIFFLDLYNSDPFLFGCMCTLITLIMGVSLGFITDQIMRHTGIDLTKRTIVEH
jgi:hypothetical protein